MSATKELLSRLESLARENPRCGKMFCTTCGGYGYPVFENLDNETQALINIVLNTASIKEFTSLKGWRYKIVSSRETKVLDLFLRNFSTLDSNNIRELDEIIFNSRIAYNIYAPSDRNGRLLYRLSDLEAKKDLFLEAFNSILDEATNTILKTRDSSLLETITLVDRDIVAKSQPLKDLLIELAKDNSQLARVAYNFYREELPEVRGFLGDGTTKMAY